MLRRFLPKSNDFFNYFEQLSRLTIDASKEFVKLMEADGSRTARIARIKNLEHEADSVTHGCIEALHKTFITPIDRDDIHRLIKRMDDVMDSIDAAAARIVLYKITTMRSEAIELAKVICNANVQLEEAVHWLRDLKNPDKITQKCISIHQLENDGDTILRLALTRLFDDETDAIQVIKWKEIFERLEGATDRCEDVANIIEGIVIEAS